jgi:23S rRNA pseudouridine2605 synthase
MGKEEEIEESGKKGIRLNRYLAKAGVCSRREADNLIKKGLVEVDGRIVIEMGYHVQPGEEVKYCGEKMVAEAKRYILINKPKDCVTTMKDTHGRRTVFDIVQYACDERVYPVGRLDMDTTGVLLMTNDGDLAKKLTHPSHNKKKIYHAFLDREMSQEDLDKLRNGFELEDGFIKADKADFANIEDKSEVGVEIHSGRNRIVRRMFDHLGYKVGKLDRVFFAGLTKKKLPRGKWRFLSKKELDFLRMQ